MRISLSSPVRKAAFLSGTALLLLTYFALCWQQFVAFWITRTPTLRSVELATRIQPQNPYFYRLLGEYYLDHDHQRAAENFEIALRLDPNSAKIALELANAYQLLGQSKKQHDLIRRALANAPKDVVVEWEAANLFLTQGDVASGLRLMSDVAAFDDARRATAIQTIFRFSDNNVASALRVLPQSSRVRQDFLQWLLDSAKFAEADQAWPAVMKASGQLDRNIVFRYVNSLISRREVTRAHSVWQDFSSRDTAIQKSIDTDNLVSNGDFESSILNAGFDWRTRPVAGISLAEQSSVFHGGNRAVQLDIDAAEIQDGGLQQLIPVEPNSTYSLHAFLRADELECASGMRLAITDYYTGAVLLITNEVLGSFPWRETAAEFTTPADTHLVKFGFARTPDMGRIRGHLWIDDVRLEKK